MEWQDEYRKKCVSMEEAAKQVKSGDTVVTALGIAANSADMYHAILNRHAELRGVNIIDAVQVRPCKLYDPEFMAGIDGHINYMPAFGMITIRKINATLQTDFLPIMSSDSGRKIGLLADVFACMTTPPNKQGYVNLGLTNFYTMQTIREGRASGKQRVTIAEVNDQMPTIFGNNWMHVSEFDFFVEHSTPIPAFKRAEPGEREKKIAGHVLELLKDGDTIQMGIGMIPEAVVSGLEGKHDLGVLTEMFPIGLPDLVKKGIVTNSRKPLHKGITIATFCIGDQGLYDYVAENPACEFFPASYTNNPAMIAQHPNLVAINMGLMIDFSGQICSEGVGHRMISGSGGQLDFMIGAAYSEGGRGITLISAARNLKDGSLVSAIVPELPIGSPVTVPRTLADYVVSEYGIAQLRYKSRRQRAEALISIAHPDLRGELRDSLKKRFYPKASRP
ncbi:MAG: Succinyl-CoA:coenzyme A transferase [Syntrophaceae bacterium PtaB.Bin095]|jgi:4-hydroxybutyrate CoA-transferase|nr:MAG: Succinyl-CoA:coenzyme A transferase [Syntrophaceae bacterium PtaB.Bin095]